jgi:hypothetical protein
MSKSLLKTIKLAQSGGTVPAVQLVEANPEMAAVVSKMVSSPQHRPNFNEQGQRRFDNPDILRMRESVVRVSRNASDAEMVMQMLPDMELSAQILVSSILSPKDMMTTEVNYAAPEGVLPIQVSAELLTVLRTHFEQVYKIKPHLAPILRECLFEEGSHVKVVIPESSIDDIIHRSSSVSLEDLKETLVESDGRFKSFGFLGSSDDAAMTPQAGKISLEEFSSYANGATSKLSDVSQQVMLKGRYTQLGVHSTDKKADNIAFENLRDENVVVIDNPFVLKFPEIQQRLREERVQSMLRRHTKAGIAQEAFYGQSPDKLSDREMQSAMYRPASPRRRLVSVMKTQEQLTRRTVGQPLVMQLPSESVIPVHVPGQENVHVGYFVLLDANGNPVSRKNQRDHYSELGDRLRQGSQGGTGGQQQSFTSQMIGKVNNLINGFDCGNKEHLDYSFRVYQDMVEQDLMARLKNGVYANGVQLASNAEVYRIMLSRTLAAQQSQLLFLPVEFVTYFAFRYTPDGLGKSLLDDMKVLNSLRVMLMFANSMASIRNSVPMQDIKIKLDEQDPDPYKTIERHIQETVRLKQSGFPIAVSSPVELTDYLQRAGMNFHFSGHPGLPDIEVERSDTARSVTKPDTELEDSLRKRGIMATGLSPETVDQGFAGDFATSVVANNILLSRRVNQYQQEFTPQVADHVRKYVRASADLQDQLREIIANGLQEDWMPPAERKKVFGSEAFNKVAVTEYLLAEFLRGLEITLPNPSVTTTENQFAAFEKFVQLLEPALDAWVSSEFLTEAFAGQVGNKADEIKKLIRAYFVRRWMQENGVLSELSAITAEDGEGKPAVDFWQTNADHIQALVRSLSKFIQTTQPAREAGDAIMAAVGADDSASSGGASALDDMAAGGASSGSGDEFGAGLDLDNLGGPDSGLEASPSDLGQDPQEQLDDEVPPQVEDEQQPNLNGDLPPLN